MSESTLTILAPAFYTNPEWSTRYLRQSAARHRVPIHWYGSGEPFRGWLDVQVDRLLAECRKVTTSHILYTDSSDAILLADVDEIMTKYDKLGWPDILMSVEADGEVCAGGWMADIEWAIDALVWLSGWHNNESNPQVMWRDAIRDREIEVMYDSLRTVFMAADEPLHIANDRVVRRSPDGPRWPCVLHWAGGYTDPAVGKAALIEPVWKELGYAPTTAV